jgi:hypothetical protein
MPAPSSSGAYRRTCTRSQPPIPSSPGRDRRRSRRSKPKPEGQTRAPRRPGPAHIHPQSSSLLLPCPEYKGEFPRRQKLRSAGIAAIGSAAMADGSHANRLATVCEPIEDSIRADRSEQRPRSLPPRAQPANGSRSSRPSESSIAASIDGQLKPGRSRRARRARTSRASDQLALGRRLARSSRSSARAIVSPRSISPRPASSAERASDPKGSRRSPPVPRTRLSEPEPLRGLHCG